MNLGFLQRLDKGGFGDVWLAEDLLLPQRRYAVKFFKGSSLIEASADAHLHGSALARVDHRSVVKVISIEEQSHPETKDATLAIIMEYIDGVTLDAHHGVIERDLAHAMVADLADGLEAIHEAGLIHGDIYPKNVMLIASGAKLIDIHYRFSLAKASATTATRTRREDVEDLAKIIRHILERIPDVDARLLKEAYYQGAEKSETVLELRRAFTTLVPRFIPHSTLDVPSGSTTRASASTTPTKFAKSLVRRQFFAERIVRALEIEKVCWIHGIHGIGKTTLASQAIELAEALASDRITIDCRGEVYAHDTLADAILSALGEEPPRDKRVAFRALRERVYRLRGSTLLVLDELDAFPPMAAGSALDLIMSAGLRTIIISAQPPEAFDRAKGGSTRPTSSPPPLGFVEVFPFEKEESLDYLQQRGVPSSSIVSIQKLAGGNPTLLAILADMAIEVGRVDLIFGLRGRVYWSSIQRYFAKLWDSTSKGHQPGIVVRAVMEGHRQKRTSFWSEHEEILRPVDQSLQAVNIVCPLFAAWAIREHAGHFLQEGERRKQIFGLSPRAWKEAIRYLQRCSDESVTSSLIEEQWSESGV